MHKQNILNEWLLPISSLRDLSEMNAFKNTTISKIQNMWAYFQIFRFCVLSVNKYRRHKYCISKEENEIMHNILIMQCNLTERYTALKLWRKKNSCSPSTNENLSSQ